MKMLARFFYGSIALAAIAMVAGFFTVQAWIGVIPALLNPGLWIIARERRQTWSADAGFSAYVVLAMVAAWMNVHPVWLLISIAAGLAAWDIDRYQQRRSQIGSLLTGQDPSRAHIRRLLLVECVGLLLSALALVAKIQLGFWIAIPLAALMFLGINFMLQSLRSEG